MRGPFASEDDRKKLLAKLGKRQPPPCFIPGHQLVRYMEHVWELDPKGLVHYIVKHISDGGEVKGKLEGASERPLPGHFHAQVTIRDHMLVYIHLIMDGDKLIIKGKPS